MHSEFTAAASWRENCEQELEIAGIFIVNSLTEKMVKIK